MPTSGIYDYAKSAFLSAGINLGSDTIKAALVTGYTPSYGSDHFWSDVSSYEITGTGYTAGGQTLASPVVSTDTTNHRGAFTAANPSWASSTLSATGMVLYKSTGTSSTSALICYIDFGGTKADTAGTFAVNFDPTNKAFYFG